MEEQGNIKASLLFLLRDTRGHRPLMWELYRVAFDTSESFWLWMTACLEKCCYDGRGSLLDAQ